MRKSWLLALVVGSLALAAPIQGHDRPGRFAARRQHDPVAGYHSTCAQDPFHPHPHPHRILDSTGKPAGPRYTAPPRYGRGYFGAGGIPRSFGGGK